MNKTTGLMILLSVAIVLVAPQVFAASSFQFDKSHPVGTSPGYYRSDSRNVMGAPAPMVTCVVETQATNHSDVMAEQAVDYPENAQFASTCQGTGSELSAKDIQNPHLDTPDMWNYR